MNRVLKYTLVWGWCIAGSLVQVHAEKKTPITTDPRGEPELVVCSQNLHNYGPLAVVRERVKNATQERLTSQEEALVERFVRAKCDVIAVQEVIAKSEIDATAVLNHLGLILRRRTGRVFASRSGVSNDNLIYLGYLIAQDRASILASTSYSKVALPKLVPTQKPRYFTRGPLELQLEVKPNGGTSVVKNVTLINLHFKSKAGSKGDITGLQWETYRLEEAEALRRVIEKRHAQALKSGQTILMVLGDRNANFDVASAKVLTGELTIKQFQGKAPCRLGKRGVPYCQVGTSTPPELYSVLVNDPETKLLPGSFQFKGEFSWLDEILLPAESLPFARQSFAEEQDYSSGVIYEPKKASDHALVYVTLNW